MKQILIILSSLAAVAAVGILAVLYLSNEWPTRGQIGDSFGLLNALFSGLAFAGLLYAILLQREELSLQRQELTLTRQELARSAEAQASAASGQQNLVLLNAYSGLLACKNAEISDALARYHIVTKTSSKRKVAVEYRDLRRKRSQLEGAVGSLLSAMGGQILVQRTDSDPNLDPEDESEKEPQEDGGGLSDSPANGNRAG